jgi:hypothetical protein
MKTSPRAAAFNQGRFPTIACVNQASVPLGVDFAAMVAAGQKFLDQCFVPIWGYPARLYVTEKPKSDEWQIVLMDTADVADALGYHDLTKNGQPVSKVFVKSTLSAGEKVSVTFCHELCEMLIDPGVQLWAEGPKNTLYAYEMCDAVEAEEFAVDGIAMSDFVFPSFFEPWHRAGSVQFDYLKRVRKPFETLKRGYQIIRQGDKVSQIFGSKAKARAFAKEDRRLHRGEYRR